MESTLIRSLINGLVKSGLLDSSKDRDLFDVLTLALATLSFFVSAAGVGLTYWLVSVVQNGINNRRLLKDHYIREVLEVRSEYFDLLRSLQAGELKSKDVQYRFQQLSIRVDDLMPSIMEEFSSVKDDLSAYHLSILTGVSELDEYQRKYKRNSKVFTTIKSKESLQAIHRCSIGTFNAIIRQISGSN
jgi:hypothetical protein